MIDALYFDGQSTRGNPVTLIIHQGIISMRGQGIHRKAGLSEVRISERLGRAPRILRFSDGAMVEISDQAFDGMLLTHRYREPMISSWQRHWTLSLLALVILAVALAGAYFRGLPWVADEIARRLPASVDEKFGDEGLRLLDGHYMEPSRLPPSEQSRLRNLFAGMKQPHGARTAYRLEFRRSKIGPNALALPNGVIIMTDELAQAAGNDHAVLGVLGHELGHLHHRHATRRILQTVGTGVVLHVLLGDVSSTLAALPAFVLNQKYSRDFERESDRYAIEMMRANHMPLSPMADLFIKLENVKSGNSGRNSAGNSTGPQQSGAGRKGQEKAAGQSAYLSSHPSSAERIESLRAADR